MIITYTFPPYSGIGGRRWAKFAKYLNGSGNNVEVLAAISGKEKKSPWQKDIKGIKVSFHNSFFPHSLSISPTTLKEKVFYHLSKHYLKLTTKGNYYDKSVKWGKHLRKLVEMKIQNQAFDEVFVSCAPFRMAYELIPLVKKYNDIKWVVDFRDPWTTNRTAYGFESLSKKRQFFERDAEKEVVQSYNEVISVANQMTDYFKSLDLYNPGKFKTIYNGFDPDDFNEFTKQDSTDNIGFIFAGNLYNNAMQAFKLFSHGISELKEISPKLYYQLGFTFIGVPNQKIKYLNHPNINILPYLHFDEVKKLYSRSEIGLLFLTPDIDWSFSTKFCDYIGSKLKILVVSQEESITGKFCKENNIGETFFSNSNENLATIIENLSKMKIEKSGFDRNQFNLERLTNLIDA